MLAHPSSPSGVHVTARPNAGPGSPEIRRTGDPHRSPVGRLRLAVAALITVALLIAGCGSDDDGNGSAPPESSMTTETSPTTSLEDAEAAANARVEAAQARVKAAQDALTETGQQACGDTKTYVEAIDRYGKLFSDDAATVGDVKTAGADLVAPRETVIAAAAEVDAAKTALVQAEQELIDAEAALAVAAASASTEPIPSTSAVTATMATMVPPVTIERVQQAEDDLAQAAGGITDATLLTEATVQYNSAALALQIAWLRLISEAGCLDDDQQVHAVELVTAYTTTLQTELTQIGYYDGPVDGIYGPQTVDAVKRSQADSGLPQTGFVDMATARALDDKLAAVGAQAAAAQSTHITSVQTVLTLAGFWTGSIDGVWTAELTAALQAFQGKLGVEPTGVVDAATLAAFELGLVELARPPDPTTTTETAKATQTETAIETAVKTATETALETAVKTATVTVTEPPIKVPPVTVTKTVTPESTPDSKSPSPTG
jgi:peptidoglycan hydrolase-like protein with peptidoglycan-binding domain